MTKLHHKQIAHLSRGRHSDGRSLYFHSDGNGAGKWTCRLSFAGKKVEVGLGAFPAVSLKQARDANEEARQKAARGVDPRSRHKDTSASPVVSDGATVADLAKLFEESHVPTLAKGGQKAYRQKLRTNIVKPLGERPISDLRMADLDHVFGPMLAHSFTTVQRTLDILRTFLGWARRRGADCSELIVSDYRKERPYRAAHKKYRIAKDAGKHSFAAIRWQNYPEVYQRLDESDLSAVACKVAILTGLRRRSVHELRKDQVGGDLLAMSADQMKAQRGHVIPANAELRRVLSVACDLAKDNGRDDLFGHIHIDRLIRAIKAIDPRGNLHGGRHAIGNFLKERDHDRATIKESLSHSLRDGQTSDYVRQGDLAAYREGLRQWEAHLTGQRGGLSLVA